MSGDFRRPDSEKSRRDLLDEIYFLRDIAGEREEQVRQLQQHVDELKSSLHHRTGQLNEVLNSRSWRITSPVRVLVLWIRTGLSWWLRPAAPEGALPPRPGPAGDGKLNAPQVGASQPMSVPLRPVSESPLLQTATERDASAPSLQPSPGSRSVAAAADPPRALSETRSLFVDVTEVALRDGHTGVQRVVREVLRVLLESPPEGYTVVPVRAEAGQPYRCALAFAARFLGNPAPDRPDPPIQPRAGDVFLGLDHAMDAVVGNADVLAAMRAAGVALHFICNDTLPLSRPDCFPPEVGRSFRAWLETIARIADGIACISHSTESELRNSLDTLRVQRTGPLELGWFHLGSDIEVAGNTGSTTERATALNALQEVPTFLMVGTIEPRKGHAQALEAFDLLWQQGHDVALVLVGWPGWMTDIVTRRIRHNEEFGKRLFWFQGAGDEVLEDLYNRCTALLAPSEAEGFGLPLVEAARHGLPILCRDLPVFREVAGDHAAYFSGHDGESLAAAIRGWLAMREHDDAPASAGMALLDWRESTEKLLGMVLRGRWGTRWEPAQPI